MAQHRPAISNEIKEQLVREAGGKCANPGCPNLRTNFHHIINWAVYQTHDAQHMIAVCPSCHDAIHYGTLLISDLVLYSWKGLERSSDVVRTHLYVEPGRPVKLLLGSIAVSCQEGATVFQLSSHNRLEFRILIGDILLMNLHVTSLSGRKVLSIVDNNIRHEPDPHVRYNQVPGHLRMTAPVSTEYIPTWALEKMRIHEPTYGLDNPLTLLELEVVRPGVVKVQGLWADNTKCIVITQELMSVIYPTIRERYSLSGGGESTVLNWVGPIYDSIFTMFHV